MRHGATTHTHKQSGNSLYPLLFSFPFCFLEGILFPSILYHFAVSSLYIDRVNVFLPDDVFLPFDVSPEWSSR